MNVRLRNAIENFKYSESSLELDVSIPFEKLIPEIKEHLKTKEKELDYYLIKGSERTLIKDYSQSLKTMNFHFEQSIQIEKKIIFPVSSNLMIGINYFGPFAIIFYFLFVHFGYANCHYVQITASFLIMIHYIKRILECAYVHEQGVQKVSLFSSDIFKVIFYYWFLFGYLVGYNLFLVDYSDYMMSPYFVLVFVLAFIYCELNNLYSHLILMKVKEENNGQRGIPSKGLFTKVTCAHYFWELLTWISFSLLTNYFYAYLWVLFSFCSMGLMSHSRHQSMKKYFGETYPKDRKAFIPYIL